MSERNPFEQQPKGSGGQHRAGRELRCEEWEALLADALDGVMPAADGAIFEAHSNDCAACAGLLAQSRQGQEWMRFLQARAGDAGRPDGAHFEPDERRGRGSSAGGIWRSYRGWSRMCWPCRGENLCGIHA